MRPRTVASLACRIIALWVGVNVVVLAISIVVVTEGRVALPRELWASVGVRAAVAWLLWMSADRLGRVMAPDSVGDAPVTRSMVDLHTVALSVVGVVLVAEAIPALVAVAVSGPEIGPTGRLSAGGDFGFFNRSASVISGLVRMGIGALLAVRSGDLARRLGRHYPESPSEPETR